MRKLILAAAALLACASAAQAAESYTVDPKHTFVSFEVNHLGLSTQRGRFNTTSGKVTIDKEAKTGTIAIEIEAASVSTGVADLEKHLRAADFFDVEKHPKVTFKSTKMEVDGEKVVGVEGDLTMLGVTKPVALKVLSSNCRVHPMNKKYVCGVDASTTVKRSEFGMTYAVPAVSDEVKLNIAVEAIKD